MIESTQHLSFRLIPFVSSCLTFRGMSLLRGRGSDLGRGEICVSFCCQAWCCCHPHNLFFIYRSCSIPLNLLSPPFWQLAQRCFLPTGFSFRSRRYQAIEGFFLLHLHFLSFSVTALRSMSPEVRRRLNSIGNYMWNEGMLTLGVGSRGGMVRLPLN